MNISKCNSRRFEIKFKPWRSLRAERVGIVRFVVLDASLPTLFSSSCFEVLRVAKVPLDAADLFLLTCGESPSDTENS